MNEQEYILNQISQECVEVSREVSKALHFGLHDCNPKEEPLRSNKHKIESEISDLLGSIDKAVSHGYLDGHVIFNAISRQEKVKKIEKWMNHARRVGTLI